MAEAKPKLGGRFAFTAQPAKHLETSNDVAPGPRTATAGSAFLGTVDAKQATIQEHQMSPWQGIKLYPKAIGWSGNFVYGYYHGRLW